MKRTYDSTVARIAGNLLSGTRLPGSLDPNGRSAPLDRRRLAENAVLMARAIVAEVQRTEPASQEGATR